MTLDDSVHAFRLRVMARAQVLGNVSQACREAGISRTLFYRWRRRYTAYGAPGLHPRRHSPRRGRPSALTVQTERAILALALAWPTWGPARLAVQLSRPEYGSWRVAPATIYRLLRRTDLRTRFQRLAVLEAHSAQAAGLLTERTRRRLTAARMSPRSARAISSVWTRSTSGSSRGSARCGSTPRATRPARMPSPRSRRSARRRPPRGS
jgi:transposase